MYDIVFCILNFNGREELKECIESINEKCPNNYIVVVDNGSTKESIIYLEQLLENIGNVTLIKNDRNLGFAKGNNVGFRYIKNNIKCKYIAMINSDVIIIQNDLVEKLNAAYDKFRFAILGPNIIPQKSNPMITKPLTKQEVLAMVNRMQRGYLIMNIPVVNMIWLAKNKFNFLVHHSKKLNTTANDSVVENCQLHGCCLFFSENYCLDGLNEQTFLYGEEEILYKMCMDNNLKTLYDPSIEIYHNESTSTKRAFSNPIKRKKLLYKNLVNSYKVLLSLYE